MVKRISKTASKQLLWDMAYCGVVPSEEGEGGLRWGGGGLIAAGGGRVFRWAVRGGERLLSD